MQGIVYGFIRYYMANGNGRFYFSSDDLARMLGSTKGTIDNCILYLSKKHLIKTSRKQRSGGGTIRFITGVSTYNHLTTQGDLISPTSELHIKENKIKENKKNIHKTKFYVLFSSYGLSKEYIEEAFEHKKSLDCIINMCGYIKEISKKLGIKPVYNKDTINATNILWNKYELNDIDEFISKLQLDWDVEVENYQELVRKDYYLPEGISYF